jgi:hypothetical protein
MLKSFWQKTLQFLVFTAIAIAITFSSPLLAQATSSAEGPSSPSMETKNMEKEREVVCPEGQSSITKDGNTIPCKQAEKDIPSPPANTYDMEAIKKFDRELYGD